MAGWCPIRKSFNFLCSLTFWPQGHVVSLDIKKLLYLDFQKTYKQQTWQDDALSGKALIYHVQWPFDRKITWYHVICLKVLYFDFHETYKHQTWQEDALQWEVFIYYLQWSFDLVVIWYHVIFKSCYILIFMRPMNIQLGRMVLYNETLSFTMPSDLFSTWLHDLTWHLSQVTLKSVAIVKMPCISCLKNVLQHN